MDKQNSTYFTNEALAKMVLVQGKTLAQVVIILWQNAIDPNNSLEIIDSLQLRFTDGERITIGCNEIGDGLDIVEPNFQETKKQLDAEFGGKIKLHVLDASKTKMWDSIPGKILTSMRVTREEENFKADSLVLDFGDEGRTIAISPNDGLVIDYYEEV
ncbi:MAG: hypothetical protein IPI93_03355 [Sphingobacteriaceae bacterium]|nr:hypothetical protein [Sphingobacteriaceae bacterium]